MTRHFGAKTGMWLFRVCRGIDDEAVEGGHDQAIYMWLVLLCGSLFVPCSSLSVLQVQSMMAAKSFSPLHDPSAADTWLELLSRELAGRLLASGSGRGSIVDGNDSVDEAASASCAISATPRRPRTLTLHFRGPVPKTTTGREQQVLGGSLLIRNPIK